MRKQRRHRKRHRILAFFAVAMSVLLAWTVWGTTALERTDIEFASARVPAAMDGFVIAQVSDLHDAVLGEENADITDMLREIRPDIIVLTGDMVDSNRGNIDRSVALARRLVEIAPVYYANGNHEAALSYNEYHRFTRGLSEAGVTVLEDRSEILSYNGTPFQIIGLNDLGFIKGGFSEKCAAMQSALDLLTQDGMFSLVLSHRPELMDHYAACAPELVLSGHAHGGQFRLPLLGGLYSPGQGFFPKYDGGLYTQGGTSLIVSYQVYAS